VKPLTVALAAALLAAGVAACGSGGEDSSNATEASEQGQTSGETSSKGKGSEEGGGKTAKPKNGGETSGGGEADRSKEAAEFSPKRHDDSGGGSKQYVVKGGDNSVQEFGKEAPSGEFDAAATALHNFLDARAEGNWAAACNYMSKGAREGFEKLAERAESIEDKSCGGILEKLTNPAAKQALKEEAAKADAGSLRVEGDRSFVIYTAGEKTILAMPMAHEGGAWKVAGLAGTPLN
jgi:hypothetical protein